MSSRFDNARGLLRASIADCFGYPIAITTVEGEHREITGYIKEAKQGEHVVHQLFTSELLPEECSTSYKGNDYMLVYELPVQGNGSDSQISREYVMIQKGNGARVDGWSEFPN